MIFVVEIDGGVINLLDSAGNVIDPAKEGTLGDVKTILTAIRDTAGVKKITDALPAGGNEVGKVAQGTKAAATDAWPQVLYDAAGNPVNVFLDGTTRRLSVDAKVIGGESQTVTAKRTTTATSEQDLIVYTVPSGKKFLLTGYSFSAGTSTVNGVFKLGQGSNPLPDPANPGTVDSGLVRGIFLLGKTSQTEQMASPLFVATAGQTVRLTVTPDGVTSTIWRATLDFVLRDV